MDMLKKIIGALLIVVGAAVAIHTVVEPLYHASSESQPYAPLWNILDPIMAVAIVLTIIFGHIRKRNACAENETVVTREFLSANVVFYGIVFIGIIFFWNYFNLLSPAYNAIGPDAVSLAWIIIDAALPLLLGAMGIHLFKAEDA